jgi:hypothetical protein
MSISVDVSDRVGNLPVEIQAAISNMDFVRFGISGMNAIKERTSQGTDVDGFEFAPYSDWWKAERQAAGKQVSFVDLIFHDNMLAAMDIQSEDFGASIGFRTQAEAEKAAGNQEKRNFFDLNADEVDEGLTDIIDLIIEELNNGGR